MAQKNNSEMLLAGLLIGRGKKTSNFAGFSETDALTKAADFVGVLRKFLGLTLPKNIR